MATIVKMFGVNLSGVPYLLIFMSDGSAYALNVISFTSSLIGAAGTFPDPRDVAIWEGNIALIIDASSGYWRWPGAGQGTGADAPTAETIPAPTLVPGGLAGVVEEGTHLYAVTFVINGVETNLGLSATIDLDEDRKVHVNDVPTGPTGTTQRLVYRTTANQTDDFGLVHTFNNNNATGFTDNTPDGSLGVAPPPAGEVNAGNHQWAVTFVNGGESNLSNPSPLVSISPAGTILLSDIPAGPGGTTSRNIYRTTLANPSTFFLAGSIPDNTTDEFSDILADNALGAAAPGQSPLNEATLIDATKTGTTLAVFAGRVWIANNRTVQFTAPNTFNNFNIQEAAGSFVMTDSNFIGPIYKLLTALDVLWIFGESAINQLSNVTVLQNTTTTTFSNINISSSVGTTFPQSVIAFLRQIEFATKYGIIQQIGVTPQRISEKIDGTYTLLDLSEPVTAGLVVLNNILCYGLMVTYRDPDNNGDPRKIILLVTFDGKWFIGSQGDGLIRMASVEHDGGYRLFGADEHNVKELFVEPHYPVHRLKSPFFDFSDVSAGKEFVALMMVMNYTTTTTIIATCTPVTWLGDKNTLEPDKTNELLPMGGQGSPILFPPVQINSEGYNMPVWMIGGMNSKLIGFDMSWDSDPFEVLGYVMDVITRESWGDFR